MRLEIDEKNAKTLVTELWEQITTTGFGSQSKNDFYDYVLYLFSKYDESHFLENNTVYANSQILKVTSQKVKNSIVNISLKYYEAGEKLEIPLKFLHLITAEKITPEEGEGKKDKYTIVVEDKRIHTYLDSVLKKEQGISFDNELNDEKITLRVKSFYKLCYAVIKDLCEKSGQDITRLADIIYKQNRAAQNKTLKNALFSGVINTTDKLFYSPIPIKEVSETLSAVGNYFKEWRDAKAEVKKLPKA